MHTPASARTLAACAQLPVPWCCRVNGIYVSDVWERLKKIPYYTARVASGGKGPPRQVASAVKDILEKFVTSADRRVGPQHMPTQLETLRWAWRMAAAAEQRLA